MRKYIFSAMALVLGLFTVTAVLAFSISDRITLIQDKTYEFQSGMLNPEEAWKDPSNWVEENNPNCSTGIHPCSLTLPEGVSLADYLQGLIAKNVQYYDLVNQDEIEPRPAP